MFSKQTTEGYLEINHKESPGITPEEAAQAGRGTMPVGRGVRFQSATYNCCGCEALIVKNPLRTRERHYCARHDSYLCDRCKAIEHETGEPHKPFKQIIEEFVNSAAKKGISNGP